MNEELILNSNKTKTKRLVNFLVENKKYFYIGISILIIIIFSIFVYQDFQKKKNLQIANRYIIASKNYLDLNKEFSLKEFKEIVNTNNPTFAPLSLFFLIDNKIVQSEKDVNKLFDQVINNVSLDKEIKNLIIYKKGLFNSEIKSENELINILKPIINSNSIWKPHSLLLLGDYFLSKGEKKKAKDFYIQILDEEKNNKKIISQTQSRVRNNFSE